jgi:uncharacterized membrane protein YraQ (UPF0718 family)
MPPEAIKRRNPLRDASFLVLAGIALTAGTLCYMKGEAVFFKGLDASWLMFLEVMPRMLAAFLMAGFVQVLVPRDLIVQWIGEKSGVKGITIATLAGICTPGGPMISFPLIVALHKLGADFGPLIGYLTSWELMGIQRIVIWEIPMMGVRFAALRFLVSLSLPVIAGLIARKLVLHLGDSFKVERGG